MPQPGLDRESPPHPRDRFARITVLLISDTFS